jgi:hypothetical protein
MSLLYSNNKHPETNILHTGFKNISTVNNTIKLISKRSIIYQKSIINTMYNRAKFHPNQTTDMLKAMNIMKKWLNKNKDKTYKYEYLDLDIIRKFEKLANKYDISRVARGLDKPTKSDYGFLVIYKKYGKQKLPFIPIFSKKPKSGDYDIFREKYINARLGQMKKMKIPLYNIDGLPTKHHLTLIMNGYSPDKDIKKKLKLL